MVTNYKWRREYYLTVMQVMNLNMFVGEERAGSSDHEEGASEGGDWSLARSAAPGWIWAQSDTFDAVVVFAAWINWNLFYCLDKLKFILK